MGAIYPKSCRQGLREVQYPTLRAARSQPAKGETAQGPSRGCLDRPNAASPHRGMCGAKFSHNEEGRMDVRYHVDEPLSRDTW